MKNIISGLLALTTIAALAACGGGSGSGSTAVPAAPSGANQNASAPTGAQRVTIRINVPGKSPASGTRRPAYVGAGTQSAVFTVTPSGATASPSTTVNCTSVCQGTVSAFPGSNTFAVSLYDGQNGTGSLLSSGSATQTIVAGSNTVNLTFNGVPMYVAVTGTPSSFANGTPASSSLTVTAFDADSNTIIGSAAYSSPINLTSSQPYITFAPAQVTAPGQSVTANYDGTTVGTSTTVTIFGAIGSGAPTSAGSLMVIPGSSGPTPSASTLTVTAGGGTNTVTVSETGFSGSFTVVNDTCTGPGNATINPTTAPGPSATFTITGVTSTGALPCSYGFSDGSSSTSVMVTVQ